MSDEFDIHGHLEALEGESEVSCPYCGHVQYRDQQDAAEYHEYMGDPSRAAQAICENDDCGLTFHVQVSEPGQTQEEIDDLSETNVDMSDTDYDE